jgi:adenine-specific DNA-methyltransferase
VLFIEKGMRLPCPTGLLTFIIPKPVLMMSTYRKSRELLISNFLRLVLDCKEEAFQQGVVPTCVILVQRKKLAEDYPIHLLEVSGKGFVDLHVINRSTVLQDAEMRINITAGSQALAIISRLKKRGKPLSEYCYVEDGINPGPFREWLITSSKESSKHVKVIEGRTFNRYLPIKWEGKWLLWDKEALRKKQKSHPNSIAVLGDAKRFMVAEKIVTRQTAHGIIATLDTNKFFCTNSVHTTRKKPGCTFDIRYLLGLMNSRLISFYYQNEFKEKESTFPQVKVNKLRTIPIPEPTDRIGSSIESLATEVLSVKQSDPYGVTLPLEREIDQLVYKLYGLSDEEIKIVEGAR